MVHFEGICKNTLVENSADIDHQSKDGMITLHFAAYGGYGNPKGSVETARILIEHAAALDIKDIDERTPLDIAGPESEIEELLRKAMAKALNS